MPKYFTPSTIALLALDLCCGVPAHAAEHRGAPALTPEPKMVLRIELQQPPHEGALTDANRRLTQSAVATPNIKLTVYGPCKDASVGEVSIYGTAGTIDPLNMWTGLCPAPVAVALEDLRHYLDLTGAAKIRWVTRAHNLHAVHPVLRLADGTLIVGDHADSIPPWPGAYGGGFPAMVETEFSLAPLHWYKLDPETVTVRSVENNPDLSKVDAVGFVDLMPSGGHGDAGWINVSEIEVFGRLVSR